MVGMNEHTQDTRYDAIAATQFTSQQDEIISTWTNCQSSSAKKTGTICTLPSTFSTAKGFRSLHSHNHPWR